MEDQTSSTAAVQLASAEGYIQVAMHADANDWILGSPQSPQLSKTLILLGRINMINIDKQS